MSQTHLRYPALSTPQVLPLNDPHPGAWFALDDVLRHAKNLEDTTASLEPVWRLRCSGVFRNDVRTQAGVLAISAPGIVLVQRAFPSSTRLRTIRDAATVDAFLASNHVSLLSHDRSSPTAVYAAYVRFCPTIAARPVSPKALTIGLNQRGFTRTRSGAHPNWIGIAACPF